MFHRTFPCSFRVENISKFLDILRLKLVILGLLVVTAFVTITIMISYHYFVFMHGLLLLEYLSFHDNYDKLLLGKKFPKIK